MEQIEMRWLHRTGGVDKFMEDDTLMIKKLIEQGSVKNFPLALQYRYWVSRGGGGEFTEWKNVKIVKEHELDTRTK